MPPQKIADFRLPIVDCKRRGRFQWPITRTDGSLTNAPGVVNRPVLSISCRSITRRGDSEVVPMRRTFTRCGISEPVTKTVVVCSCCCCEARLVGSSANTGRASRHVATTAIAKFRRLRVFTNHATLANRSCKPLSTHGTPSLGASRPPLPQGED